MSGLFCHHVALDDVAMLWRKFKLGSSVHVNKCVFNKNVDNLGIVLHNTDLLPF